MKITKSKLKQIIREELNSVLEGDRHSYNIPGDYENFGPRSGERHSSPEKFTHPDYPGIIFTKMPDPKSGLDVYRGEDPNSPYGIFVDNPRKTRQMEPVD